MTNIRRIYIPEQLCFITNITYMRTPILIDNIDLFWKGIETAHKTSDFELRAWVILNDHFHIMVVPETINISNLMHSIKLSFSMNYRKMHNCSGSIWQKRFWDHLIRDEEDYYQHLNYIHYNPVKHGYVKNVFDYPHSSITNFKDLYSDNWGMNEDDQVNAEFGE
jgi:putative transposase